MKIILSKFTSRKFLLALLVVITSALQGFDASGSDEYKVVYLVVSVIAAVAYIVNETKIDIAAVTTEIIEVKDQIEDVLEGGNVDVKD